MYGSFEYIKDSGDFLRSLEVLKTSAKQWDWEDTIIFTIDVKALYPSVKFEHLRKALNHVFDSYTTWSDAIRETLVDLILYTLENQQIRWDGKFYMLNQGLPTGAKHSVPLANIFMSFIVLEALRSCPELDTLFASKVKLWKRFIDDGVGVFLGNITEFYNFFQLLQSVFRRYDLELTCDTDSHTVDASGINVKQECCVSFLDIELFKVNGTLHTKEFRKETSSKNYITRKSAHPSYTFPGIVKSQLYRLRRLCSRDVDFHTAVSNLKERCLNSGYCPKMVGNILKQSTNLERDLGGVVLPTKIDPFCVRLITLCGTVNEKQFSDFSKRMNGVLSSSGLSIIIVKTTSLTLGQTLFNNNDVECVEKTCKNGKCVVCPNNIRSPLNHVVSTVNGHIYPIDTNINCEQGGIYVVEGACHEQYTGKTVNFSNRFTEHFTTSKSSAVYCHKQKCSTCNSAKDFKVSYVENYQKRGKYSLSEREFLWNHRIKGTINIQKTLKS